MAEQGALKGLEKVQMEQQGARQYWVGEVQAAMKREKEYRKKARQVVAIYEAERATDNMDSQAPRASSFNILYSNTETLLPALYNSTPRPIVKRRFMDADPLGLVAAKAVTRVLAFMADSGDAEYSPFDQVMERAVLEGGVPGRGVTWVKYDAEFETIAGEAEEGEEEEEPAERVSYETVCWEEVPWDRFLCGYARKWSDVPWIGREHVMTAEELVKNFGREKAARTALVSPMSTSWGDNHAEKRYDEEATGAQEVAFVYEIWDKTSKKVFFVSEQYEDGLLKEVADPLGLSGFFPCPQPLQFVARVSDLTPIPLYEMYRDQAEELNSITTRLKFLIRALKVRGFYNGAIQEIDNVLEAEDNTLIPAVNIAALEGKTLDAHIWLVPIDVIVNVVQQLYMQRNQVKQVIYEITGIADIMRGSTNAAETAEAQAIKNQWGTLRLKRMQRRVMMYAREILRITAEIACKKFGEKTFAGMTGLPYPTSEEKMQAQMQLAQLQQQQAMMPPGPPGPDGQPTPPPPNPQMQQLQQTVGMPSWGDIIGLLRQDLLRNYRIDIETNSTIDLDATEDKKEIGEFLNAMAQLLNGLTPAVEGGLFTMDVAKQLVMTILRRFRFTDEIEPMLLEAGKQEQRVDPKVQAEQMKAQAEQQKTQADMAIAAEKAKLDREKMMMTAEFEREEHKMKMQELVMKDQMAKAKFEQQMMLMQQKAAMPAKPAGDQRGAA